MTATTAVESSTLAPSALRLDRSVVRPDRSVVRLLALAVLAGCADGSTPAGDGSDAGPLHLLSSDVHVVGTSESIAEVQDLEVLPDGSVWVLNSLEPFFIGFPGGGEGPLVFGEAGGGPREFRRPAGFVTGGLDGQAWVFDAGRHALIRVAGPDAEWAEVDLPRESLPPGTVLPGRSMLSTVARTARLGDEVLIPRTTGSLSMGLYPFRVAILQSDLMGVDAADGTVRGVLSLKDALEDPSAGFELSEGGFPLWYRLWAVCGDELRVYDRTANLVRGFGAGGTELTPIALPAVAPTEVTPVQFTLAVYDLRAAEASGAVGVDLTPEDSARVVNQMAQQLTSSPAQLAAYLPRYVDLRCSDDGTVWMQPIDPDRGNLEGSDTWLRMGPGGSVRRVTFPERFDPFRFTVDRVWGVQRDELDVASVAWIEAPM